MRATLLDFLDESDRRRLEQSRIKPVITVSRAFGCPAKDMAALLVPELDRLQPKANKQKASWRWISKSVVSQAAEELQMDPQLVVRAGHQRKVSLMEDLVRGFSPKYAPTNEKIRRTIGNVVERFTDEGYVIMIGRGSEVLTRNRPNTMHLRLVAPASWRAARVAELRGLSEEASLKLVERMDADRLRFRNSFARSQNVEELFDIQLDCSRFTVEQLTQIVLKAATEMGLH